MVSVSVNLTDIKNLRIKERKEKSCRISEYLIEKN